MASSTSSSAMTMDLSSGGGKKRPRDDVDDPNVKEHDDLTVSTANNKSNRNDDGAPPPLYGSQEYWDQRYKTQFESILLQQQKNSAVHHEKSVKNSQHKQPIQAADSKEEEEEKGDDTTLPYHAWYFTYHELRPLLLPIVLGDGRAKAHIAGEHDESSSSTCQQHESAEKDRNRIPKREGNNNEGEGKNIAKKIEDEEIEGEVDIDDDGEEDEGEVELEEEEEDGEDDDASDTVEEREGLASKGPIRVLEIGCGDVPLGAALAADILELQDTTGEAVVHVLHRIVCTDYSNVVIEMMRKHYCTGEIHSIQTDKNPAFQQVHLRDVPLEFATVDARKIPYDEETFELILEKGTLDAMLSDNKNGTQDCIEIVSECARVLKENGCLIIVSHINAHTPSGLMWLDKVISSGLKKASELHSLWKIEVHGNSAIVDDDSDGRVPKGSAGPAVYVCWKSRQDETHKPASEPRLLLKMLDYSA